MSDMSAVIHPKSDQLNADDMISGPMTVTITGVKIQPGQDQPVSVSIAGTSKVWRPCKTTARILVAVWGADANQYVGRSLTLYRDPKVKWGGLEVGGIRISHMSHMEREMTLMMTVSKANRQPAKIKPLQATEAPQEPDDALQQAETAARNGTASFRAWWSSDAGKACRATATANLDRLRAMAAEADPPPDDDAPPM